MNWVMLTSLHEIYRNGQTKIKPTLKRDSTIKSIVGTKELIEVGAFLIQGEGFQAYYERYHLENFCKYKDFLERNGLLKPQTRFEERDVQVLMNLEAKMKSGELLEIRDQMIEAEESVRGVSSMFFKNEKYLLGKNALINAVKHILNITELADDKDQQYKYVLECENPKAIVLCENLDFLKKPSRLRKHNIELWYAGGKNVAKLDYVDTRGLPVFYSCDWDYDGLLIYQMVKEKIKDIELLMPNAESKSIKSTDHNSLWKSRSKPGMLSGLDTRLYSDNYQKKIRHLIESDHWITEENNDLTEMVMNLLNK